MQLKTTHYSNQDNGIIFNVQRFSIHDGPGVRTVIFFKGCNLRCLWCHNPESISRNVELMFNSDKCINCGSCFEICPQKAHRKDRKGNHYIDRRLCRSCFRCCENCFTDALTRAGVKMGIQEIMKPIIEDLPYYDSSPTGGGVTVSGGEPMLQIDLLTALLSECKNHGIHTAVDTAGHIVWNYFEKILPYADMFLFDLKALNSDTHRKLTGVDNKIILSNLNLLSKVNKPIRIRIPLIIGYNDNEIVHIGDFLNSIGIGEVEIMPYHKLGECKYNALTQIYKCSNFTVPSDREVEIAISLLRNKGLNVRRS